MTHLWVRAEQRPNEERAGITAEGVRALIAAGIRVTVEESSTRAAGLTGYTEAGAEIAPETHRRSRIPCDLHVRDGAVSTSDRSTVYIDETITLSLQLSALLLYRPMRPGKVGFVYISLLILVRVSFKQG